MPGTRTRRRRSDAASPSRRHKRLKVDETLPRDAGLQTALLLFEPKTKYAVKHDYPIPERNENELLIRVTAIGLNPVDWKSPDFNFGIPRLPFIAGRDFAGVVVQAPKNGSRIREGDLVLCPSTDYRDFRKAAFQQYAIATSSTVCRIPKNLSKEHGASLGVAFVAATIALGVCFGAPFHKIEGYAKGPDLLKIVRDIPEDQLPNDVVEECLRGIKEAERPVPGEWIAIYGGSSTTGYFMCQLAKLIGLRVISLVDVRKHGASLYDSGADILVDIHDTSRAIDIVRAITGGKLRFALDCIGKQTATHLQAMLTRKNEVDTSPLAHLVGLSGVPKEEDETVRRHMVPIKIQHESAVVGEALMTWLERLLESGSVKPPPLEVFEGGLTKVNDALDKMRRGEICGKRLVTPLE